MNEIFRVLRAASWRLLIVDLLRTLAVTLTAALGAVLVVRIVEKLFGVQIPWSSPWGGVWAWTGAAAGMSAILWTAARRRQDSQVALELDERAGLRESLSTALHVRASQDPWSQAVVETARAKAVGVKVREAIPIELPRLWPVPIATGAALALLWFTLRDIDVMGILKKKNEVAQQQLKLQEVKADIQAKDQKLQELLAKAGMSDLKKDDPSAKPGDRGADVPKPEDVQRAAVKQLTDLKDRLAAMKTGEKSDQAQAMKDAMRQLKQPGDGPLNDFYRSLARGNFDQADAALKDLSQKMSDDQMSDAQKQQLKEQLKNLSEQMKQGAQKQDDLKKKLEAAGMDPKQAEKLLKELAKNPDALKKAIEQMKNLSPEQQKKLAQMAQAASKAAQQSQNMSEGMSKMAEGMDKQGMNEEGQQGMNEVASELGSAEMLQQDMDSLNAAMGECNSQLAELGECLGGGQGECEGDPKLGALEEGDSRDKKGSGSGGPGRGNYGGPRPDNAQDFSIKKEKAKVATGKGPIIGTRLVFGDQVKSDAQAEFSAAAEAAEKAATDAIENQQVPRELQNSVKSYFGRLSDKSKPAAVPAKAATPPAAPATDAKDAPKK